MIYGYKSKLLDIFWEQRRIPMRTIEGKLISKGYKFALIISRFNELISKKLLDGAIDCLLRHEVKDKDVTIIWVPGSFEIPLAAQKAAQTKKFDAVICLGALIRGATPHFEYISAEVTKGISQVSLQTGIPVIYGILTTDTVEQAIERAGTKGGNKGFNAAAAAVEMVNLFKEIGNGPKA